jgi:hypothetical protein
MPSPTTPLSNTSVSSQQADEHDAHDALDRAYGDFRSGVVRVLQARQIDPRSGSAIAQSLGLNRQLAWQVATIAAEASPAAGLAVIPGTRGLEMLLEASRKQLPGAQIGTASAGAPSDIASLKAAIERLEAVILRHAGDRAMLSLLTAAWDSAEVERRTEDLRRDAYRAQCALLGAKVSTQVRGVVFGLSRNPQTAHEKVAMATYQGMSDVTRVRAGHRSRLFYLELPTHDDGKLDTAVASLQEHLREKFQLEPELSSVGPEAIELLTDGAGASYRGWVALRAGPIGASASMTLAFTGLSSYENPRYPTPRDTLNQIAIVCHIPTELLLVDCLMDKRLAESADFVRSLRLQCFDASTGHPMKPVTSADPAFLFDLTSVEPMGPDLLQADPDFANTGALVARAAARVGTTPDQLVGVRYRVRYMMAPMSVLVTRALPEKPA